MKVDDNDLDDTVVKKKSHSKNIFNGSNVVLISEQELLKAACCNLSESFETNPAVDESLGCFNRFQNRNARTEMPLYIDY